MGLELPESPKPQPNISLLAEGSVISGLDLDPGIIVGWRLHNDAKADI
jgi:hypothetical protein